MNGDADIHKDEARFGLERRIPALDGYFNQREKLCNGPADLECGDIRPPGGIVTDPDGYVVSVETFMATGQSWKPFRAHVSGDCAGPGDL